MNSKVSKPVFWLHKLENALLFIFLFVAISLAVVQIVMRNVFETGLPWLEPLLRILTLWLGLLGAMIAVREGRHITIDVLSTYLPQKITFYLQKLGRVFSMLVTALLSWTAFQMVLMEKEFETLAVLNVPVWWYQSVLPIAFFIMALRYFIQIFAPLSVSHPINPDKT